MKKKTKYVLAISAIALVASTAGIYAEMPVMFSITSGVVGFAAGFVIALDKIYTRANNGEPMNDATMTEVLEEIL